MTHRILFALLVACGGGGGGSPTRAITAEEAQPGCRASCEHDVDCGNRDDLEGCVTECVDEAAGVIRVDAFEIFFECATAQACTENDDVCLGPVEPLAIHLEWEAACRSYIATCDELDLRCDATGEESGVFRLIAPEVMTELIACFDSSCETLFGCMDAVFEQ